MWKPGFRDRWNTKNTWQVLSFFRLLLFQLFRPESCNLHLDPDLNCKETNLNWNQRFISNFIYWKSVIKGNTVLVLHIIVKENISFVLKILCSFEQWWFLFRRILDWTPLSTQAIFSVIKNTVLERGCYFLIGLGNWYFNPASCLKDICWFPKKCAAQSFMLSFDSIPLWSYIVRESLAFRNA